MTLRRLVILVILAVLLDVALLVLPPGTAALDARLYYRGGEALAFVDALGGAGRRAYAFHEGLDLVFIATYALVVRALAKRLRVATPLVYAPAAFDLLETTGILVLLATYASGPPLPELAAALGVLTLLKWVSLASVVAIAIAAVRRKTR
jgi:hypothetical protein